MQIRASGLVLSPTDLSAFLACRHRTGLDLAVATGELEKPEWRDPLSQAFRDRGLAHERAYAESLRARGFEVLDLSNVPDGEARTLEAIRRGVPVIYQAVLAGDGWRGYADVLVRVDEPSALGAWSYEVHDAKLARETRGGTILQLAVYSDLLGGVQQRVPDRFHVVTPASSTAASATLGSAPVSPGVPQPAAGAHGSDSSVAFAVHSYRFADYAAYVRRVRAQLLGLLPAGAESIRSASYPEPVEACDLCHWERRCRSRRRADDHLSFIAGISRSQRDELSAHGCATLAAAAVLPAPLPFKPTRGSRASFARIADQARVQLQQRLQGAPVHELLPVEAGFGLARLPEPSPGDVFLDLEGARFAREGGREYLFGISTGGLSPDGVSPPKGPTYRAWWAWDDAQERAAFEQVIDLLMQRWAAHPGMHVYHFAHYEPSTFRRLMGRHASRGDELDRLLRGQRFVDLYAVVRQALRAGVESYSIKQLEAFYGFRRDVALDDAAPNLQAIELALEGQAAAGIPDDVRVAVQGYNQDDCRSTSALRDWLEDLRAEFAGRGTEVPRPEAPSDAAPEKVSALEAQEQAATERLLAALPPVASDRAHAGHPRWLFAHLLGWHRRENKAQYWERYRLNDLSDEDRFDDGAAIAGLELVERVEIVRRKGSGKPTGSVIDRYRYPPQECEIGRKGDLYVTGPRKFGTVAAHDRVAREIDVKKGEEQAEVHPTSMFLSDVISLDVLRKSLLRQSEDLDTVTCGTDLLFRRPPRLTSGPFAREPGESETEFAVRLATTLDRTTLAVQGPPGAGKTYIGAQMIGALVKAGSRVGVVAVSHKVIRNLLVAVAEQAARAGERVRLAHKCDADDDTPNDDGVREIDDNPDALAAITDREVDVLGGTAWLWAREDFAAAVDVLFVDEAGQMSLANVLAVSPAASSLVLLGDPQQLQQPQKASHPDGVDISALEHVLGDHQTMPPEHGLFLPTTWRLAPEVCAFTSEMFYEGKLSSRAGLERQRLTGTGALDGAGLRWLPVEHDGNRTWSLEEIDAVEALVDRLLAHGAQWVDADGQAHQMTPADLRVVAPYNAHVSRLLERLDRRGVPVGTVDKFQGQEAAVVIYAMGSSSPADAPRGMEFLYSLNRLNVATSRARCAVFVVASPRVLEPECRTPRQMRLANAMCRYVELARTSPGSVLTAPTA